MRNYTPTHRDVGIIVFLAVIGILFITINRYNTATKSQSVAETHIQIPEEPQEEPVQELATTHQRLSSQEALRERNVFNIVDIRSPQDFAANHVLGSSHIADTEISALSENVLVISAQEGLTALKIRAADQIAKNGRTVFILDDSYETFQRAGAITLGAPDPGSFTDHSKVILTEPRDLNTRIKEEDPSLLIIDVRRSGNFKKSHIPGAINIPLAEIENKYDTLDRNASLYIYGQDEDQSFNAGVLIHNIGLRSAKTINGGFTAWTSFGYPTESEK